VARGLTRWFEAATKPDAIARLLAKHGLGPPRPQAAAEYAAERPAPTPSPVGIAGAREGEVEGDMGDLSTTTCRPVDHDLSTPNDLSTTTCRPRPVDHDLSTNRPVDQSTCRPIDLSTNRPVDQSTNRPVDQSTCRPVDQSTCRPMTCRPFCVALRPQAAHMPRQRPAREKGSMMRDVVGAGLCHGI